MQLPKSMQEFPHDPPEKPWWQRWMVLFFILFVIGCTAYCCIFPGIIGQFVPNVRYEANISTAVLNDYMKAMAANNPEQALTYIATQNSSGISLEDLESQLNGADNSLYTGYQGLKVTDARLRRDRYTGEVNTSFA